jgi:hypothetical protein
MIGCVLATVGVIGLLRMAHHHRWHGCGGWQRRLRHRYHGGWGHGGWGGPWGHHFGHPAFDDGPGFGNDNDLGDGFGPGAPDGPRGFGSRIVMRGVLDQLEATPAQERVIVAAAEEFRAEAAKFRGELRKSRGDIAGAFRKSSFDEVALGELYARHDTAIEGLRRAFVGLGAKVHDALDEKQRARLADIIESGPRFLGRAFRSRFRRGFDRGAWGW